MHIAVCSVFAKSDIQPWIWLYFVFNSVLFCSVRSCSGIFFCLPAVLVYCIMSLSETNHSLALIGVELFLMSVFVKVSARCHAVKWKRLPFSFMTWKFFNNDIYSESWEIEFSKGFFFLLFLIALCNKFITITIYTSQNECK